MKYLLLLTLLLTSCTLGAAFNTYHHEWASIVKPTKQAIDVTITVRIRGFGDQDEKQRNFPWGKASSGVMVETDPPQIWIDVAEDKDGNIMIPPHILGHELTHALRLKDKRILDPDKYRDMR